MILQALNSYYERLQEDPKSGIAPIGFSQQKIAFSITLNADGSLHGIEDLRTQSGKKLVPRALVVPGNAKPSGSGINPCFLWDNPAYLLGYKADDPNPDRTRESFDAFKERHRTLEKEIGDPHFSAVCHFLKQWKPEKAGKHQVLVEIGTGFGVFRIRAQKGYVHERSAVKKWWRKHLATASTDKVTIVGQCLVTGEIGPLARLHEPKIKGVWGGQPAGALLCSVRFSLYCG